MQINFNLTELQYMPQKKRKEETIPSAHKDGNIYSTFGIKNIF